MIKKKIIFLAIVVLLVLVYGIGVWTVVDPIQSVSLSAGKADEVLPAEQDTVFFIRGEWLAAWTPDGPENLPVAEEEFKSVSNGFAGIWNSHREDFYRPAIGSAAYYCTFQTRGREGIQAIALPAFNSASRVFINGEEVFLQGVPGGSFLEEVAAVRPMTALFEQNSDDVEILIHVSNFNAFTGGSPQLGIEYGVPGAIHKMLAVSGHLYLAIILVFVGFFLYCGIRSAFLKEDKYHFYLSLGFAILLGRIFIGNFFVFESAELVKGLSYQLAVRLKILMMYLSVPVFINFGFQFLDGIGRSKKPVIVSLIAGAAGAVLALVMPGPLLAFLEPTEYLALGIAVAFLVFLGVRGIVKKVALSALFTVGFGFIFLFTIYFILFSLGIVVFNSIYWLGLIFSLLILTVVLAYRESRFLQSTVGLRTKLDEVVASRNSILISLTDESGATLDKVNDLTKTLIQGALGPLNSDQLVTASLVLSNNMLHQNLLYDTIDLVNLGENRLKIKKDSINLYAVVSLNIGSFQPVIMGLSVSIINEIPREVPQIWADEKKLGQILFTFFSFCIENTTEGLVTISSERVGEELAISIFIKGLDSEESLEKSLKVLELEGRAYFSQGANDSAALRLFLTRELIRLHGSDLQVERNGTEITFSFNLPVFEHLEAVDEALPEELAIHLDAIQNLQPLLDDVESERDIRILAAAGNPGNLQIIKSQLASMNYQIRSVLTGAEIFKNVGESLPDMIVIDSSLLDMTCFDVCRALRNEYTPDELPIILIIEDTSDVMQTLTSGASDYLRKPYQQEEFLTRVNTYLQLSKINSIYSQFVPKEFLKALGQENIIDLKLGDQVQREMTILFVDIRAFTNLSENMTPQENFKFINSYLSQFTPIITRNGGFVDKFIGDAIMALYPDKPEDAIRTAIEMVEYVKIYNGYRANCGYEPINIGIGIHTGKMILGIVGDSQRMQGTVISDAVNLASRIQDVTKLYKSNVVISQETFVKMENPTDFNFRFLGKVKVKGKAKSVSLFEIFNADDDMIRALKEETKGEFETAILLFAKREFLEAKNLFQKVLIIHPYDRTAQLFLDRADKFLASEKKSFLTSL